MTAWQPGDSVVWRTVIDGRVRWALPHAFVADDHDVVALYLPTGTRGKRPDRGIRLGDFRSAKDPWGHENHVWASNHVLRLTRFGVAHSIHLHWAEGSWSFGGWYVNLQDPLRPTRVGYDTVDHALDLVAAPDGSWAWKDEEELALCVDLGLLTSDQAARARAEGERVLHDWPFPTGWEDWRPDPAWPVPALPPGWKVV